MNNAVIPAPARFDPNGGQFTLRSGMTIAYLNTDVAPIVERFCSEVTRRTGLGVLPMIRNPGPNDCCVRAASGHAAALPSVPMNSRRPMWIAM